MKTRLLISCIVALSGSAASAQVTVNVSQDLVRLGIASSNMIPGRPDLDSTPLLVAAIAYAKSGGTNRIIADRGAYYLLSRQNPVSYVPVSDTNNLTIDLQGSDLYFADPWIACGLLLVGNTNLTLQNFTLDFLKPPVTQLKVTSVSGSDLQYTVQPGYQDPSAFNGFSNNVYALIYRNGKRVSGLNHLTRLPVQLPISAGRLTVRTDCCVFTPAVLQQIRPGDIAAVFAFSGSPLGGTNCVGCVFRNLTIYSGFGPGLFSAESSVFERVYTIPRPGTDRLSSASGGLSLLHPGSKNLVRFCRSIGTTDEPFNYESFFLGEIKTVTDARSVILGGSKGALAALGIWKQILGQAPGVTGNPDLTLTPKVGAPIIFERPTDRVVLGSAIVTSATTPTPDAQGFLQMTVKFDRDLPAGLVGAVIYGSDDRYAGGNSSVERNASEYVAYSDGIGLAMANGSVKGNYIRNATTAGIFAYSEYLSSSAATPPMRNVTISNNVIDTSNTDRDYGGAELGGIVFSAQGTGFVEAKTSVHQNIVVKGNFIANPGVAGIWMDNTSYGTITENYLLHPNDRYTPNLGYPQFNADSQTPLPVRNSENTTITNNTVDQTSGRVWISDSHFRDLAAYASGSVIRLNAYNLGKLASPTVTMTDADGVLTAAKIETSADHYLDVLVPAGMALGGAYVAVSAGAAKSFGTLFIDNQDNVPALNGCTYEVSPSSTSVGTSGGSVPVLVVTQAGCSYQAVTTDGFVRAGNGGSGTGVVSVDVSMNGGLARTATIEIGGQPITVTQSALSPVVQAIVDAWDYTPGIARGTWVTITGSNLATGAPQVWDLTGRQQLPTALGGVTVTFNGNFAPLSYVSATQINALVPALVAPGTVQVVVANGIASSSFPFTATATLPSIYALPTSDASAFFVTAALAGTGTLIGNSATDPRVTRAALPGDILDLYMLGLGGTVDPSKFLTNQVFAGAYPVSTAVTANIGGKPAEVVFAGLTSPGLYLVRVAVPSDLTAGPQTIQVTADGAATSPSLRLMVATP